LIFMMIISSDIMRKYVIMLIVVAMILICGCISDVFPVTKVLSDDSQTFNDTEQVRQHFIGSLNSGMTNFWKAPLYNDSLSEIAMAYAKNGTNSFKISGNTPDEAINVFETFESQHYNYWVSTHWLASNQHDHPGASYGIAVYKTGNQYNVSVVYNTPQPVTTVYHNGTNTLYYPPDVMSYLWSDGTYQPGKFENKY
jgi:hypothetical protein